MKLTTHLHLVPRLRMSGAVPLLHLYAFMEWTRTHFAFYPCNVVAPQADACVTLVVTPHVRFYASIKGRRSFFPHFDNPGSAAVVDHATGPFNSVTSDSESVSCCAFNSTFDNSNIRTTAIPNTFTSFDRKCYGFTEVSVFAVSVPCLSVQQTCCNC